MSLEGLTIEETQTLLTLTDRVFSIVMPLLVFNVSLPKDHAADTLPHA